MWALPSLYPAVLTSTQHTCSHSGIIILWLHKVLISLPLWKKMVRESIKLYKYTYVICIMYYTYTLYTSTYIHYVHLHVWCVYMYICLHMHKMFLRDTQVASKKESRCLGQGMKEILQCTSCTLCIHWTMWIYYLFKTVKYGINCTWWSQWTQQWGVHWIRKEVGFLSHLDDWMPKVVSLRACVQGPACGGPGGSLEPQWYPHSCPQDAAHPRLGCWVRSNPTLQLRRHMSHQSYIAQVASGLRGKHPKDWNHQVEVTGT